MKRGIKHILVGINGILSALLALLGFPSCSGGGYEMYGTPYAEFTIKGKVVDKTDRPIPKIQIRSPYGYAPEYADTLYTDNKGEFVYTTNALREKDAIPLLFADIDGKDNGGDFAPDSLSVPFKSTDFKGSDGEWNLGKATKEVKVVLKEKEKDE